jgi:hypothetical protein
MHSQQHHHHHQQYRTIYSFGFGLDSTYTYPPTLLSVIPDYTCTSYSTYLPHDYQIRSISRSQTPTKGVSFNRRDRTPQSFGLPVTAYPALPSPHLTYCLTLLCICCLPILAQARCADPQNRLPLTQMSSENLEHSRISNESRPSVRFSREAEETCRGKTKQEYKSHRVCDRLFTT